MRVTYRLSVVMLFAAGLYGQQGGDAVVVGTVLDSSQAAVQSARVTLTHLATGAVIQILTGERGDYRTPPVRIGEYTISIEAAGFRGFNQRGLVLDIGDVREVDAVLQVGQVSDSVNVEASAPLLQTADSTVGTVVNNKQIEDLPLNGRDYLQLAALSSGTVPSTSTVGISIGGQIGSQAGFLLDGMDNNSQTILPTHGNQKEVIKPSVDAIAEFKVVTNGYAAEFGRSSSGVVSVPIKSGTNQLHGTAYEFLRNDVIDAKNLFAKAKPPYKRNDYGASAGAPIIRNKLFIFGDFEIFGIRQSTTEVDSVPTLAERQGIFPGTIYDPTTYSSATGQRAPFANNQIPASLMDPAALTAINWYPKPQTSGATNNFIYNSPANQSEQKWDLRGDYILSDRQNLFFRYSVQNQNNIAVSTLPPTPQVGLITSALPSTIDGHGFVLGYNYVLSPSLIASAHTGWNYFLDSSVTPNPTNLNHVLGLPGLGLSTSLAGLSITGLTSLGGAGLTISGAQDRQLAGDLTWIKGAHTIKFGTQAYWLQTNFDSGQQFNGTFSFTGQYTRNSSTLAGGSGIADFLLGDAASSSISNLAYLEFRTPWTHFFVQDDWKVSRHLTLNIGLRYELSPPPVEKNNQISNFNIDGNPASPQLVVAGSQGSSYEDRALQDVHHLQFAPRFGFAYSLPDEKTVVRGGYGIFYSNIIMQGGMQSMEINPPFHLRVNLSTNPNVPSLVLSNGFAPNALSTATATNVSLVSYQTSNLPPTAQEYNLDIQRQLPGGILLEVGYYGNKFDHMTWQTDGNPATPGPGNVNSNRRYLSVLVPGQSAITLADVLRVSEDGYSRYNALQAKVEKRYTRGLTFIGAYAWSKTMSLGDTSGVQNALNWNADRAVSTQDMTQHFVGSAVYALPFGKGKTFGSGWNRWVNGALGGWSVGPIVTVNTGMPINLSVNGDPANTGSTGVVGITDRPNVVGNPQLANPTVQEWFNTAAFAPNAKYTFGNAGRNILRGPGLVNLDIAAHKSFQITERISAQLRLESFNATNTPALGNPNTVVGNPLFGQITSAGAARDNQIGLKILF
ncbi:MAG: carboxypeptidase-like regulatory domain-containing protein [Bryobacteraceae bacterium]